MNGAAIENAIAAHEAGFRIVLLKQGGKTPARAFKDLPGATPEQIREWNGNFGAVVGHDHLIIDADPRNYPDGTDSLGNLIGDYPDLKKTPLRVATPSGGEHIWTRARTGGDCRKSLAGYPGVDFIHGENRYILLPGCDTEKGTYRIDDPLSGNLSDFLETIDPVPEKLWTVLTERRTSDPRPPEGHSLLHRFERCLDLVHPDGKGLVYPDGWETRGYDLWCAILAAAKYHFGDGYREKMRAWSRRGKKYDQRKFDTTWDSFHGTDGKNRTAWTLFGLADHQKDRMREKMTDYAVCPQGFVRLSTGMILSKAMFDQECAWYVPPNDKGKRPYPSVYYRGYLRVAGESRFDPTKGTLFERDRILCHNTFRPWTLTRAATGKALSGDRYENAVKTWKKHLEYICGREPRQVGGGVVTYLEHWIAHLLRFPGVKMKVAPVLYGEKGSGKGRFADGVAAMVGDEYVSHGRPADVLQGWGNYYEGKLLAVFHEFAMGTRDRTDVANMIRELVTENRVSSNLKFGTNRMIDNHCNFIFCVNEVTDLPVEPNERRYVALNLPGIHVIAEDFGMEPDEYFRRLSRVIDEDRSLLKGYYLHDFAYDEEVAKGLMYRAPETQAYRDMNEDLLSATDDSGELEEIFDTWKAIGTEASRVCCTQIALSVYRDAKGHMTKCSAVRFTKFLKNAKGYRPVSVRPRLHGKVCRFLAAQEISEKEALKDIEYLKDSSVIRKAMTGEGDPVDDSFDIPF